MHRDVVVAEGLQRGFAAGESRTEAVRGVDMRIAEGELVVLLGRSGAGKSSLLSLIGGLDRPDSGRLEVGGNSVPALRGRELERFLQRTVGWVFQSAGLVPLLSAEENVMLALRILGRDAPSAMREARLALAAVGLAERAQHRAAELSGGEQQRVAVARALVKAPLLVLADEPTAQLDTETSTSILALIREAADSGTTVLLATHDRAVVEVADRVLLMDDGRVREGDLAELRG